MKKWQLSKLLQDAQRQNSSQAVSESIFLFPPTTHYLLYGGNEEMK